MHKCCDCGKEEFLYSITCARPINPETPDRKSTGSRGLCITCVNNEMKEQGMPTLSTK
jgi:hypothetical protein